MTKEKMGLIKAENMTLKELSEFMNANNELYEAILDELIGINIDSELDRLQSLNGIEVHSVMFGSVYANDYVVDVTDVEEFLDNDFSNDLNIDNGTFYEVLEKLASDTENKELLGLLLNLMFQEVDERATLECYTLNEIVEYETDFFDNYFNQYEIVVDLDTMKEYTISDLEELGIDYQDLD